MSFSSSPPHAKKRGRVSGPEAVSDVAAALRDVASSFTNTDEAQTTPKRLTSAIRMVEHDDDLSQYERVQVMRLFRKEMAVADSYLAIEDKETRTMFIRFEMDG